MRVTGENLHLRTGHKISRRNRRHGEGMEETKEEDKGNRRSPKDGLAVKEHGDQCCWMGRIEYSRFML